MVKHIVLFKLSQKTPENLEKAVSALKGMVGRIESLRNLEVGLNFKNSERAYDIALTTSFDNKAGLKTYEDHPVHQPVREILMGLCKASAVVDFEVQ